MNFITKVNLFLTPVKLTDKLFFVKNFRLMIKSSVPVNQALQSLSEQTENVKLRKILAEVKVKVQEGNSLATAFAQYSKVFSNIFVNMIKAGEESGKLDEVLDTLTIQMYKEHNLKSKVKGALAYPIVVLTAMVAITGALIVFVMPKFTAMFMEAGMELPLPTRILIAVSGFLVKYFYLALIILIGFMVFFIKFKRTTIGKKVLHQILLHLPIVAKLAIKLNLARVSRSLASLLKTDIPVVDSFLIAKGVIRNIYYQQALESASEMLKTGATIHDSLKKYNKLFPPTIIQMINVGEETGTVDEILEELAKFYEEDLDTILNNLPSLLEPVLILVLGVTVGGIAISIMMPIFSLTQGIGTAQ